MKELAAKNLDLDQDQEGDGELDQTRELLESEYHINTEDIRNSESLTFVILDLTVNQNYDRAIKELKTYFDYKSTFPTYRIQTVRIFEHIENVIRAIKSKKSLMSFPNLNASKRKELHLAVVNHFRDLKFSLQKVTQIEYQIRIRDSRSTVWVIRTLVMCTFMITVFALLREAYETMQGPLDVIERDIVEYLYKYLNI